MSSSKINTQKELYNKVKPALRTRVNELKRNGVTFIREIDIWNFNRENKWLNSNGLTLATVVDDILNTDVKLIESYVVDKLRNENGEKNGEII